MAFTKFLGLGSPDPRRDPVVDSKGLMSRTWSGFFDRLPQTLQSIPNIINVTSLTLQNTSIAATDFAKTPLLPAGVYRASYYVQVTATDGVSSSIQVTIGWTNGGIAQTQVGTAFAGDTTTTQGSATVILRSDAAKTVTFATTYASNTAGKMKYSLDVSLERLKG